MSRSILPKSIRKFLRREKARIRREFFQSPEAEAKIKSLVEKNFKDCGKGLLKPV